MEVLLGLKDLKTTTSNIAYFTLMHDTSLEY